MKTRIAALAGSAILAAGLASADTVEIEFLADNLMMTPGTEAALGFAPDDVRGTITYNSPMMIVETGQNDNGATVDRGTLIGVDFIIEIGDLSYDASAGGFTSLTTVDTVSSPSGSRDVFRVEGFSFNGSQLDLAALGSALLQAYDTENMVFDDLTPTEDQLNMLDETSLTLSLFDRSGSYQITSNSVYFGDAPTLPATVPLPAAGMLTLFGLAGLGALARLRRRTS